MTRIGSSAPGNVFLPGPEPKVPAPLSLYKLPDELPQASHTPPTTLDLSKLILPEGIDLSRISKSHPLNASMDKLWLEVVLRAIISGGEHATRLKP